MVIRAALLSVVALALPVAAHADAMPGCAPQSQIGGDWPSYGGNYSNTRNQADERTISAEDVPTLNSAWVFSSVANGGAGDFTGTPVESNGCVYVASTRGWIFAINADTGKLVWKKLLPHGGDVNSSVFVGTRKLPAAAVKGVKKRKHSRKHAKKKHSRHKKKHAHASKTKSRKKAVPKTAGTIFLAVTRTQKFANCPPGDPCVGPYVVALDQATGDVVWSSTAIDQQPGADVYGSPVVYDGVLMLGVSGGAAELGDESDRIAFQGSMNFLNANTGAIVKKTYTIHPPKQPDDKYAGAAIWSTPAIDTADKWAFAGAGNPFKAQAEHPNTDAILKFDVDRRSAKFGEIIGSYKGTTDEYFPDTSSLPCYDIPGNPPPYYPQGIGSCGQIDMDFGASAQLWNDAKGRLLVGEGQKSGVYHVIDAHTMKPVWTQIVGPPSSVGGIVGSTAIDDGAVYGPITVPGYIWSIKRDSGDYRWLGPIGDAAHWGGPVSVANGIVYGVDFQGFFDAWDARSGVQLLKRPMVMGGGGPEGNTWGGVAIARNTVYASVGVLGLADGFIQAFRAGGVDQAAGDVEQTNLGGSSSGGGAGGAGAGPSVVSGPEAQSTGYATPVVPVNAGNQVSYVNLDIVQHDVTSVDKGPDGRPLFQSKLIGLGESTTIPGTEKLESGKQYAFYCSVHPGMKGTLVVQ